MYIVRAPEQNRGSCDSSCGSCGCPINRSLVFPHLSVQKFLVFEQGDQLFHHLSSLSRDLQVRFCADRGGNGCFDHGRGRCTPRMSLGLCLRTSTERFCCSFAILLLRLLVWGSRRSGVEGSRDFKRLPRRLRSCRHLFLGASSVPAYNTVVSESC